jgi:CDP-glucose 4,6-dehydratase
VEGLVMMALSAALPDAAFWRGKRVLLTGHTGFKGAWLALWLQRLGARVSGLSLVPTSEPNLFQLAGIEALVDSRLGDIRDAASVTDCVRRVRPEIVLHLAAQALVREGYREPVDTYATNVMGTVHLLDALRQCAGTRVALLVTTDKVYQNREWHYPYRESDVLGGHDPYSASKAASEIVIASYRDAYLAAQGVAVASARAGNVIGGGDWAPERLLPDAVRAWQADQPLRIRRPQATRPWQHVLEPLAAYLRLAERLWQEPGLAGPWNFGPRPDERATVADVVQLARTAYGSGELLIETPDNAPHEAGWLALETAKAQAQLGLTPRWSLAQAVQRTMHWYRAQQAGTSARALCVADIEAWEQSA